MKYLTLYKNNRQYITSSLNRKHPNVSFLTEENIVKYQEEPDKLDQEILDSLVAVVICDGKSNEDKDRNSIKNLVDPDNPFVLTGFDYKLNSGYGKYEVDFTILDVITDCTIIGNKIINHSEVLFIAQYSYTREGNDVESFNAKVENITKGYIGYTYRDNNGIEKSVSFTPETIKANNGIITLPKSYNTLENSTGTLGGLYGYGVDKGVTITQIPSFEGALVTDGVDDMITSTKTAQEMLNGSNEITVVSMIHQITTPNNNNYTNIIRYDPNTQGLTNIIQKDSGIGKTGIYGYTADFSNSSISVINNILGDKSDYIVPDIYTSSNISAKYSVQGWKNEANDHSEVSSVAWYWTIISKKSLTTDNINQIIKYYNLDKYIEPTIYYNVAKQGITNENHSEFNDKLIDYSGNNKDLQLYNFSWDEGSGIGKYEIDFSSLDYNNTTSVFTATYKSCSISKIIKDRSGNIFYNWGQTLAAINSTKIQVIGLDEIGAVLEFMYLDGSGNNVVKQYSADGIYDLPSSSAYQGDSYNTNFRFSIRGYIGDCNITITQIPYGVLILNGVNDYGKVTGLPIYKDYTVIVDREIESATGSLLSKEQSTDSGAFIFEYYRLEQDTTTSFGYLNSISNLDRNRKISYQSKYSYNGVPLSSGTRTDSTYMYLGTLRDGQSSFSKGAIYSILSFPYSMSEFLIERQLKMYNLGTLYPGMIEFRPVVNVNISTHYNVLEIRRTDTNELLYYYINGIIPNNKIGSYLPKDTNIQILVKWDNNRADVTQIKFNGKGYEINRRSDNAYYTNVILDKSPQEIDIYADEYIRYEDIVQPYPVLLRFNDENGNEVSWGGKFRVGSTITRIGGIDDPESNLLNELYSINGLTLNGKNITSSTHVVEKQMVFKTTATYLLDNNEPKVILSPSRLRMPNSSYKILGYIPDISGHGNHGRINNSAYAGMSGVNCYPYNWNNVVDFVATVNLVSVINSEKIEYHSVRGAIGFNYNNKSYNGKIKVTGLEEAISSNKVSRLMIYSNVSTNTEGNSDELTITKDGVYNINIKGNLENAGYVYFYVIPYSGYNGRLDSPIYLEQVGEYEGSFYLDGIDDYITIPTLSSGGKQILMKVNLKKYDTYLYDQRKNWNPYLAIVSAGNKIAYEYSNEGGKTYIDGILNEHIIDKDLVGITHNITVTNSGTQKSYSSNIGTSLAKGNFAQMALYDFMIFDNISTDDKIKELNDIVGIEGGYVERPEYYWDAYGKTNSDADRATVMDQVSKDPANALTANNFAYNEESGYGGISSIYEFSTEPTSNSQWKYYENRVSFEVLNNGNTVRITRINSSVALFYLGFSGKAYYKIRGISSGHGIKFGHDGSDPTWEMVVEEDGIYEVDWELNVNSNGQQVTNCIMSNGWQGECNITIEQVAQYQNGLVSDGIDDYLINTNMPVLTDYTWIMKRKWLTDKNEKTLLHKGDGYGKNAFLFEFTEGGQKTRSFGHDTYVIFPDLISYLSKNNYNGQTIESGANVDGNVLHVFMGSNVYPRYTEAVFYKAMLYPKTIDQLSINMLKNLFERDEIIDLTNPIFIQE